MVKYSFYECAYGGTSISFDEWVSYESRALQVLKKYNRMYTVSIPEDDPDADKKAVCALADQIYNFDLMASGEGGPVSSSSIGSVSVSYGQAANFIDLSEEGQSKTLYKILCQYLDVYRGCD